MRGDTINSFSLLNISLEAKVPALHVSSDWLVVGISLLILAIIFGAVWLLKRHNYRVYDLECELSGTPKAKFKVQRNTENLFIANRILIELTTRKAALPFDEKTDVISEVYDSWYKLFGIIRDEIKNLPGHYLVNHDPTKALIGLTRQILNDALRPHLTRHQAKYRKWLKEEEKKEANKALSPQEIQRKYPEYDELVNSLREVNQCLISFADQLDMLIKGNWKT